LAQNIARPLVDIVWAGTFPLFAEELTLRENRRVKMALRMAKLSTVKTLAGFAFPFQPSPSSAFHRAL
jgi:hypothetical protein